MCHLDWTNQMAVKNEKNQNSFILKKQLKNQNFEKRKFRYFFLFSTHFNFFFKINNRLFPRGGGTGGACEQMSTPGTEPLFT